MTVALAGPAGPAAAVRVANGWPMCAAGCGWPLDPAAAAGCDGDPAAFTRHPGCEPVRAVPIRAERPRTTAS